MLAEYAPKVVLGASVRYDKAGALKEGRDFAAEDIVCTEEGTSFTLRLGKERARIQTKLLGRHSAEDVAFAAALCSLLGMSLPEIAAAAALLTPVPHRLEKRVSGGVNILDDSYNANTAGALAAVETLKLFKGRKFVVTPGLVELGELEEKRNGELGAALVGLDGILLVGRRASPPSARVPQCGRRRREAAHPAHVARSAARLEERIESGRHRAVFERSARYLLNIRLLRPVPKKVGAGIYFISGGEYEAGRSLFRGRFQRARHFGAHGHDGGKFIEEFGL